MDGLYLLGGLMVQLAGTFLLWILTIAATHEYVRALSALMLMGAGIVLGIELVVFLRL